MATSYLVDTPNKCMRGVLLIYGPSGALLRTIPATGPSLSKADMEERMRRLLDSIASIQPDGTLHYR